MTDDKMTIIQMAAALLKACEDSGRPIVIGILDHDVVDHETNEPSLTSSLFMSVRCNTENAGKILEGLNKIKDKNADFWKAKAESEESK